MVLLRTKEKALTARMVDACQPEDHHLDATRARQLIAKIQATAPDDPARQMDLVASLWFRLHPTDYQIGNFATEDGFSGTPVRVLPQAEPDAEAAALLNAFADSLPDAANGSSRPPRFGDRFRNLSFPEDPPTTTRHGYSDADTYER